MVHCKGFPPGPRNGRPGFIAFVWVLALGLITASPGIARAGDAPSSGQEAGERRRALEDEIEALRERIRRLEEAPKQQASSGETPQPPASDSGTTEAAPAPPPPGAGENLESLRRALEEELGAVAAAAAQQPPAPPPPKSIIGFGSNNYINVSLDALVAFGTSTLQDVPSLQPGSHDPSRRGATLQNLEVVLSGNVDPYFSAQANIIFVESPEGETELEVEEIFATSTSLPADLQLKIGHFFTEFGRLNPTHPHAWDFVDQPLVNARMLGGDGMRGTGARLSWLTPTPFYSEFYLAVQNAFGEAMPGFGSNPGEDFFGRTMVERPVRSLEDLLFVPRWTGSWDLTANQTLLLGASAAVGPNGSGLDGRTRVAGLDGFWKWKSPRAHKGFPFVKVQAEAMQRRYRIAESPSEPDTTLEDRGWYAQAAWGIRKGWVVAARYGRVGGDADPLQEDPVLDRRWRASLNVTRFLTEFSKVRVQYNRDRRSAFPDAHSVWVQFEFLLGAHAAHKF